MNLCDGKCKVSGKCIEPIQKVRVSGWGGEAEFNYCQHAIQVDRENKLTVEILKEQ